MKRINFYINDIQKVDDSLIIDILFNERGRDYIDRNIYYKNYRLDIEIFNDLDTVNKMNMTIKSWNIVDEPHIVISLNQTILEKLNTDWKDIQSYAILHITFIDVPQDVASYSAYIIQNNII